MSDFSKVISHPDAEEIVGKLVNGVKPKTIVDWLKLKYPSPEEKHLRLGQSLLKDFLDSNLDLYATIQSDVKSAKNNTLDKDISDSLKNNKSYKQRIAEITETEIDIKKMLIEVNVILRQRMEQYFDRMQENPQSLKPDYGLIKYFELMLNFAEKYDKIVNQSPDQIIQHNVSVQVMDQYVVILQNCIRQTLAQIDPEASSLFLELFNEEIKKVQLPDNLQPQKPISQANRLIEAQVLSEVANSISPQSSVLSDDILFPEV